MTAANLARGGGKTSPTGSRNWGWPTSRREGGSARCGTRLTVPVPTGTAHEREAGGIWNMSENAAEGGTRPTLLRRIRDPRDVRSWNEFVNIYSPLVYGHCRKWG